MALEHVSSTPAVSRPAPVEHHPQRPAALEPLAQGPPAEDVVRDAVRGEHEVVDPETEDPELEVEEIDEVCAVSGSLTCIDDPVRMYLMQMGEIPLLGDDRGSGNA